MRDSNLQSVKRGQSFFPHFWKILPFLSIKTKSSYKKQKRVDLIHKTSALPYKRTLQKGGRLETLLWVEDMVNLAPESALCSGRIGRHDYYVPCTFLHRTHPEKGIVNKWNPSAGFSLQYENVTSDGILPLFFPSFFPKLMYVFLD